MQRSDESETAEPQKARLRCVREGRPRARTSVAVSERAQQKDWVNVSDDSLSYDPVTYQVQLPQALGRVGQIYDGVVCEVCAVGQTQLRQPREGVDAPMLESHICDGSTSCQIDAFDPVGGMYRNMRHTPIRDVLAVTQCKPAKLRTSNNRSRWQWLRWWLIVRALSSPAVHLRLVLCVRHRHLWWKFRNDPADDASEKVVSYFSAVAEVDLFQSLCLLYHL